ncbi:MAG: sulfotransferase [Gammaproteobacteria bacterium]|nr:sulfotransferase [Gammaproteobacteria bacterium]
MSSAPLFIFAPPRSFTSVSCGMIGQHPQMYGLPEVNLFVGKTWADLDELYRVRPGFRHGLLRAVAELGLGGQNEGNVRAAQSWLEENRDEETTALFGDLMSWAAPRRLVDKSPVYVYRPEALERIATGFPDAYFLHLLRHPRATCESVTKLREDGREMRQRIQQFRKKKDDSEEGDRMVDWESPDSMWLEPHQRILDLLSTRPPERCMTLRGEDLLANPAEHLKKIAGWLEVDDGPEAVSSMLAPEKSPFACLGPGNALFGNDPGFMKSPALRPYSPRPVSLDGPIQGCNGAELSPAVRELAERFGYS